MRRPQVRPHSALLITALARYENIRFFLISPDELRIPDFVREEVLEANHIPYKGMRRLGRRIAQTGHPVHDPGAERALFNEEDYIRLKNHYILDSEKMKLAKEDMIVMHPLPRVNRNFRGRGYRRARHLLQTGAVRRLHPHGAHHETFGIGGLTLC